MGGLAATVVGGDSVLVKLSGEENNEEVLVAGFFGPGFCALRSMVMLGDAYRLRHGRETRRGTAARANYRVRSRREGGDNGAEDEPGHC